MKAKKMIHGSYEEKYGISYDYFNELHRTNSNTIVDVLTFKRDDGIDYTQ